MLSTAKPHKMDYVYMYSQGDWLHHKTFQEI
jgi:hypothetical protein